MPGKQYDVIHDLALDQFGYFTTRQARTEGVSVQAVSMMVRRGVVERCSHGVYRMTSIPPSGLDPYMQAALWPANHDGVISHETALELFDISDANPSKIHITVPRRYRTHRTVPRSYVLHHADLDSGDVTVLEGIPITTPSRAIRDSRQGHVGPAIISQAIEDASRKGLITRNEAAALRAESTDATAAFRGPDIR